MENSKKMRPTYLPLLILALLVLTVLCRGMGYVYSIMATDIAYSEVTVSIMGILVECLTILRTVTGYCGILYAMSRWEVGTSYRCGGWVVATVLVCDLLDCASRYLVDAITSSITDMETIAILWLLLQFCYSTVLVMVVWCSGKFWFHPLGKRRAMPLERGVTIAVVYLFATRLVLEIYYLIDFLVAYTDVTRAEVSSILGQFLYTIVLYGGIAWGMSMGVTHLLRGGYDVHKKVTEE